MDEKKYHAESDMRTLVEAARIKKDKARSQAAMLAAKEQRKALDDVSKKSK